MTHRDELLRLLAIEEARISALHAEIADRGSRLAALRAQIENVSPAGSSTSMSPAPDQQLPSMTNALKVSLFRSLFRGREDVFPRRWENAKTGKSGYSPVCANDWIPGVCGKNKGQIERRRATCGECPHQAFLPVTDAEVAKHLRGQQVMGVYPMLLDETCWFLAVDFDKRKWEADVVEFSEVCRTNGLEVPIERSRSGTGAHAWFFFESPIPASVARKLGCYLITETMTRRHELSMESYDRLFPSQDTLPNGGFGNLIALPLQRKARNEGNSVFVDADFKPWPEQWEFLAKVKRLSSTLVHALAEEANRRGQVLGACISDDSGEGLGTPWNRAPSGVLPVTMIAEPLPQNAKAVLSQRLFIEKINLPSPLLNQLKRLAAFQNPEFYKKQSMRLSTALTPRLVSCAEEFPEHIALPRGCLYDAAALLHDHGVVLEVEDKRQAGDALKFRFRGTLTPLQARAAEALLANETGLLVAPPGTGKTVVGAYLVAARGRNTLILVHRRPLLDQWIAQLALFLGIESKEIGQIGAGRWKPNGRLDVAMIQSLVRKGTVADLVAEYGQVIQDEVHHVPAVSFERVLTEVKARFVVGLTATPQRRDGHHPILYMQLGPIRFTINAKTQSAGRPFLQKLIVRETDFEAAESCANPGIQELYAQLAASQHRNDLILDDVVRVLKEGRSPILLTERRDHLEYLAERLRGFTRHLVVLHGGMRARQRREAMAQLGSFSSGEERLLIATGRYVGEGFDDARLDTLFLALPVSWKGTLVQYTGRLHRPSPGKTEVRIYDYVDRAVPMLRSMFEKRLRSYRTIGYLQSEAPAGSRETGKSTIVGNDEGVVRYGEEDS